MVKRERRERFGVLDSIIKEGLISNVTISGAMPSSITLLLHGISVGNIEAI